MGCGWAQAVQGPNSSSHLLFSITLQPLAQPDQGDNQGRALEIQVHHRLSRGTQPKPHRERPSRAGTQSNQ